jgi:hypothetical protein
MRRTLRIARGDVARWRAAAIAVEAPPAALRRPPSSGTSQRARALEVRTGAQTGRVATMQTEAAAESSPLSESIVIPVGMSQLHEAAATAIRKAEAAGVESLALPCFSAASSTQLLVEDAADEALEAANHWLQGVVGGSSSSLKR